MAQNEVISDVSAAAAAAHQRDKTAHEMSRRRCGFPAKQSKLRHSV